MPARFSEAMNELGAGSPLLARAPARVNIMGEHSDYNDGFVLPMSTAIFTWVAASPRRDRTVQVKSHNVGETRSFNLDDFEPAESVSWLEYVKGVAAELEAFGAHLHGADILVDSDIPLGAGLSSSASLELGIGYALLAIADDSVSAPDLAMLCQRAERDYARVQCGIMDQFTLACAEHGNAILLDCRSLDVTQVPVPADMSFILTDCGVRHSLSDGGFNDRAAECTKAAELLARHVPEIESLRDLEADVLEAHKTQLGEVLYRRCRHVVTENNRVLLTVQALEQCDLRELGDLMNACHESLRQDFEVSCDELEALVAAANASNGVYGSRMTGAGFGGCVLSVTDADGVAATAAEIRANYRSMTGKNPWQHIVEPAGPAQLVGDT